MKIYNEIRANFVLEPIMSLSGHMIGGEVLTKFSKNDIYLNENDFPFYNLKVEKKEEILHEQIEMVSELERSNKNANLIFAINIDCDQLYLIFNSSELMLKISSLNFIRLELSELIHFDDLRTLSMLEMLRTSATLWLDDFGSEHASLATLETGLFEGVKIAKEFFWRNFRNPAYPGDLQILSNYCEEIIVEGVSTPKHVEFLNNLSITGMQGWLWEAVKLKSGFFRPMNLMLDLKRQH